MKLLNFMGIKSIQINIINRSKVKEFDKQINRSKK